MSQFYRSRRIGPQIAFASSVIAGSYLLALYVDSKKNRRKLKPSDFLSSYNRPQYHPDSDYPVDWVKKFWSSSRESQKTIYALTASNILVFLAWRIPAFSDYMVRYFLHSINSTPLSMLGSVFSHRSALHLGFNMFALNSFGTFLHEKMGREQFLAFYMSAGTVSSLTSHLYKSLRRNYTPSLGASGAIFGIVGASGHFPELKVSLIFLPIHSIPISQALPAIIGIDALGLLLDWKSFDHAAHLGGTCFVKNFAKIHPVESKIPSETRSSLGSTFRKTVSIFGPAILGLSLLNYQEFPMVLYILALALSAVICASSFFVIMKLNQSIKTNSIIGISEWIGAEIAAITVISISTANILKAGAYLSLSFQLINNFILHSKVSISSWIVGMLLGLVYVGSFFIKARSLAFGVAKYSFAILLFGSAAYRYIMYQDEIYQQSNDSFNMSLKVSLKTLYEFISATGIFLFVFLSRATTEASLFDNKKRPNNREIASSIFTADILSSILGIVFISMILLSQNTKLFDVLLDHTILPFWAWGSLCHLVALILLVQAIECTDISVKISYFYFKSLASDGLKSLNHPFFQYMVSTSLSVSVLFYLNNPLGSLKSVTLEFIYILCLTIVFPWLIIPVATTIKRLNHLSGGLSIGSWISCIISGGFGIALSACVLLGISSLQSPKLFNLMRKNLIEAIIIFFVCFLIYLIFLIIDNWAYPPRAQDTRLKCSSDIVAESSPYGKNYAVEIFMAISVIASLSDGYWAYNGIQTSNVFEEWFLFIGVLFYKLFYHSSLILLCLNLVVIFMFGRKISYEIGPCHFAAFFLSAGIASEIIENILDLHLFNRYNASCGISGVILALIAKSVLKEDFLIYFKFIPLHGREFLVYYFSSSATFLITRVASGISHEGHIAGMLIGLFFWGISERIWKFKRPIHNFLFKKK